MRFLQTAAARVSRACTGVGNVVIKLRRGDLPFGTRQTWRQVYVTVVLFSLGLGCFSRQMFLRDTYQSGNIL